jgi:D-alanine-D-alanine ligase
MHRIRVGVLRGGPSSEYDISLKTGATVLNNLPQDKYHSRDIFIDKEGQWHMHGLPVLPHSALNHLDVVFNALHGHYGEDGKVQHILETHKIPFTGTKSFNSILNINKIHSKEILKKNNIKTPRHIIENSIKNIKDTIIKIFRSFPLPVIVKPSFGNGSQGISVVKSFDNLEDAIKEAQKYSDDVIIEEYIIGKDCSSVVIDKYRDHDYYALPAVGNLNIEEKRVVEQIAKSAHEALGLRHYSSSDFIIHPKIGVYLIHTNSLPQLSDEAIFKESLENVGSSLPHFLDHILELALSRK